MKLMFWYNSRSGSRQSSSACSAAPVQLFFLGVLGEYVGSIYTQVRNRPLVVEAERINFDDEANDSPTGRPADRPPR